MVGKDKTKRMLRKNQLAEQEFLKHWEKQYKVLGREGMVVANPNVRLEIVRNQPRFYMTCVKCKQEKLATTDFFTAGNVGKWGMHAWLKRGPKGLPYFCNNMSRPCNACFAQMCFQARRVHNSLDYWQHLMMSYPRIAWQDAQAKFNQTQYGYITGVHMKLLVAQAGHILRIGVHDIEREHVANGTKHNRDNHKLETCEFDMAIINVPQRNKIPDLRQAWINMFEITLWMLVDKLETITAEMQDNWPKTPTQVGVTASRKGEPNAYARQKRKLHVRYALHTMVLCHKKSDTKCKRPEGNATSWGYLSILSLHDWRCAVCRVPLTLRDDMWTDVSMDRIDNARSHDIDNIRPVCQLHQVTAMHKTDVFTRAMHLHLAAITVHLEGMRTPKHIAMLKKEHDKLIANDNQMCAFCAREPLL